MRLLPLSSLAGSGESHNTKNELIFELVFYITKNLAGFGLGRDAGYCGARVSDGDWPY